MKLWSVAFVVAALTIGWANGCAKQQGSSANVPEPAIEKAASTKIDDAGSEETTPTEPSGPSDASSPAAIGSATR